MKIFSLSVCRLLFCLIYHIPWLTEAFQFWDLVIVALSVYATGVILRKCSVPMCWRLLPTFSSIRFSVSGFMLRSLIHLDLSFVQGDRYGSICILLHADIQLDWHQLLKDAFFFPLCVISVFFIRNQVSRSVWIYVWVFDLIPWTHLSVFMPVPHRFITIAL